MASSSPKLSPKGSSDNMSAKSRISGSTAVDPEKSSTKIEPPEQHEPLHQVASTEEEIMEFQSIVHRHDATSPAEEKEEAILEKDDIEANAGLARTTTASSRISRIMSRLSSRKSGIIATIDAPVTNLDEGIVGWESRHDPEYPQNFAESRKYFLLTLLSSITFISPLASSMFAPAIEFVNEDFHNTSSIKSSLVVSIFVLGFAVGPLILAPLSEVYGRRPVLTGANAFFCVWQIGCALAPNLNSLIIFRLLSGIGGSGCLTIGGGVISDMFRPDQRGKASAIYSIGPLFGPVIGPICGGFIAQRAGWRWVYWVLLIAATTITIFIEVMNRETNHKVLIGRKVKRLRKELNRPELISCYDRRDVTPPTDMEVLKRGLITPFKMFASPIIIFLSLYMAVIYGLLYLLFTTITTVFVSSYGWAAEISGLAYLGLGIGFMLGIVAVSRLSDATVVRLTKQSGRFEPEYRLQACIIFACFIPITFFWYGWSAYYKVHWIVPIIGLMPFGLGMMGLFIPVQTYVIDAFTQYAASGIAVLAFTRSLFGAFLPIAGPYMYDAMGLGWGNSTLGFIAIGLIPIPLLGYKYGKVIRTKYPLKI